MPDRLSKRPPDSGRRRVFLSSTWKDLRSERAAVRDALLGVVDVVAMEDFRPNRHPGLRTCLEQLNTCDAILLIVGSRHGTIVPGTTYSVTELEYDFAQSLGMETFVYEQVLDTHEPNRPDNDGAADMARVKDFRHRLRNAHYTPPPPFSSPQELGTRSLHDITQWTTEPGRPSFGGQRRQAVRSPEGYALADLSGRILRARPFPVMIVDLSALNAKDYPPEPLGGLRITKKALAIRETSRGHRSPLDILNDFPVQLAETAALLEARVELVAKKQALLVCLAHSTADLGQLRHFIDCPAEIALFSPEEAELPKDLKITHHKTYSQQQLRRCGLTKMVLDYVRARVDQHLVMSVRHGT